MLFYIKLYVATLISFFAVDILWIGFIARGFYRKHLGFILATHPNWTAAMIFYLLFVLGIIIFVVIPGLEANSFKFVLSRAILFGLITYATYDLTNMATVENWPAIVTVVDMLWGTALSTAVSFAGYGIGKWLSVSPSGI